MGGAGGGGPSIKGFVTSAVLGGVATEVTGGKFKNGAASAAFMYAVSAGVRSVDKLNSGGGSVASDAPLSERQAAARKELEALSTDGTLNTEKVFTGDNALDSAAKEVLGAVHPVSERYKVEIGGQLVANGDGYSYGMPTVGDNGSVAISGIGAAGGYHTHPGGYGYRHFSNSHSNNGRPADVGWVKKWSVPLYMSHMGQDGASISDRACMPNSAACSTATYMTRSRRGREL